MRTTKLFLTSACAALLFASCAIDDPIYNTVHPDHGRITLTTDWSATNASATPPSYTVSVGDYTATLTGTVNTIDNLFTPGDYHARIHNMAEHISVGGHTATAASATAPAGLTGTFVNNNPGWFYTSALDVAIERDTDHEFTAPMRQQVIQLTFTVTPSGGTADLVQSITGTLGGVAGAMDMDTEVRSAPSSVALTFAKQADGTWKATIRVLGIVGDQQPLYTVVKFTGGTPGDVEDTTDIHDAIEDNFDTDGGPAAGEGGGAPGGGGGNDTGIDLGTEIVETPTGGGFTATITGWTTDSGNIDVQ